MRPKTLAEIAKIAISGESFDRSVSNFLDEFYASPDAKTLTVAMAVSENPLSRA